MKPKHIDLIASQLALSTKQVANTANLLQEGATIPFVARYRKELTGSLDEVQIADIQKELNRLAELEKRRQSILKSIEEQGKLTDELRARIEATYDLPVLEDIYLPYKRKRKTRASAAREKGLTPLAEQLFEQGRGDVEQMAATYINEEVPTVEEALQGARDIIAELINEDEQARNKIRRLFERHATIRSKVVKSKEEKAAKYRDYFKFEELLWKCPSHRLLAIRRGEEEGLLRVYIEPEEEKALLYLGEIFLKGYGGATDQVKMAIEDGYKRLLSPSIETEFRKSSKEIADEEAIRVFADNLRQLLLAPPLGQVRTLAIDPGFRTGCKVVCLAESGQLLHHSTIYPHPPQSDEKGAIERIKSLVHQFGIQAIAIGNGTAGRETMALFRNVQFNQPVQLYMVNESGASIYSASAIAREEFPDKDVTVRGAVSIGRRLMDPLAELVKIDAKSIGVGQYQHDVNQNRLKEQLDQVVESCVNAVGINLNTASKHLLTYVSGLGPALAQNIINHREENGLFKSRSELKKVARMGDKAFELAAGFLRIRQAKNPLDNTAVHPESYAIVKNMVKDLNCSIDQLIGDKQLRKQLKPERYVSEKAGIPTIRDILRELEKPGLDPRGEAQPFEFAQGVHTMEDLREGMILPGLVTNITNFGAFVDIGIKQDGLVHISQLANRYVKNPTEVVTLQQRVRVKVLEVDIARKRIHLSMKDAT
ncbi:MAG: Tex family protein [Bacteroidota bacterium]